MIVAGAKVSSKLESRFLRIKVQGTHGVTRSVELFEWLAEETARHGTSCVLLDLRGLKGELSTADRFDIGFAAARVSAKVAVLARATMIDPERFGELVARNRGAHGQVFASEAEAVAWLAEA